MTISGIEDPAEWMKRYEKLSESEPPYKILPWKLHQIAEDTVKFSFCDPCEYSRQIGQMMIHKVRLIKDKKKNRCWAYDQNEKWFGEDHARYTFAVRHIQYLIDVENDNA